MPPVAVDTVLKIDRGKEAHILATSQSPRRNDLQEAGAETRAGLALRESCLSRAPRSLVGAERVDEDGVHGRHIAGGESHPAPP